MAERSAIEWTDHTWTLVAGCDPVSPACAKCYAALLAARLESMGHAKYAGLATRHGNLGKWTGEVRFWQPELAVPLLVRRPGRWFLTSMGDIAHDAVTDAQIADAFAVMAVAGAAGQFSLHGKPAGPHTFMVLTKRIDRLAKLLASMDFRLQVARAAYDWGWNRVDAGWLAGGIYPFDARRACNFWTLPNVFIGCTAEDQEWADARRPAMASVAAAGWKTFVSYEPALGPVNWAGWEFLKQIISGGEAAHKSRPSHPDWHRGARDWAAQHGVAYLFKQHGDWVSVSMVAGAGQHHTFADGATVRRVGKKAAGRLLDGREHNDLAEVTS